MRHAKSDWSHDLVDFERPLNKRGEQSAKRMGEELLGKGVLPEYIISSAAKRALTTTKLFAEASNFSGETTFVEDFYYGSYWDFVDAIKKTSDSVSSLMLVGHNPSCENFIHNFAPNFRFEKFPTAAIAKFNLDIKSWKKFSVEVADIEWLIKPKDFK